MTLESSFEGKDYVCDRLLQYLFVASSSDNVDKVSFQLLEVLLYRVHLNLFTGRMGSALAILQVKPQTFQRLHVAEQAEPKNVSKNVFNFKGV